MEEKLGVFRCCGNKSLKTPESIIFWTEIEYQRFKKKPCKGINNLFSSIYHNYPANNIRII